MHEMAKENLSTPPNEGFRVSVRDDDVITDEDILTKVFTSKPASIDFNLPYHNMHLAWRGERFHSHVIKQMIWEKKPDLDLFSKTVSPFVQQEMIPLLLHHILD